MYELHDVKCLPDDGRVFTEAIHTRGRDIGALKGGKDFIFALKGGEGGGEERKEERERKREIDIEKERRGAEQRKLIAIQDKEEDINSRLKLVFACKCV